ncbi:endo-beta-1,3-glucanase [Paramyrothecium foliicola]|nr:endo-beta-1,3-glucanase [Paramyrothecium foliicola]
MQNYSRADPYEREPLDSSQTLYDSPVRGSPPRPRHAEYDDVEPPYYDSSPANYSNQPYSRDRENHYGAPEVPYANHSRGYGGHNAFDSPRPPHFDGSYNHGSRSRGEAAITTGDHEMGYVHRSESSTITPGGDNFGSTAAGGMAGIAYNVADHNARESGMHALHSGGQVPPPPSRAQPNYAARQPYPSQVAGGYGYDYGYDSNSSLAAPGPAATRGSSRSPSRSPHSYASGDPYVDDPYQGLSSTARGGNPNLGVVNPLEIEDDGDDGLHYSKQSQRNSMLSASNSDRGSRPGHGATAAAGLAAAAGGVAGAALGKSGLRHGDGYYDPPAGPEKTSAWSTTRRAEEKTKSKKKKWLIIILVFLIVAGAIVGGVVGSFVAGNKAGGKESGSGKGQSAKDDQEQNGDLDKASDDIKALMNNPDLHKVFPGMDYTPINTQYPYCMHEPPSQNNVTRDVAVLSQLTNKIRLYGTDCNQTQMVIHAVNQLELSDTVKIWMGVWQDKNTTTNERQLQQMWDILDEYGSKPFEGIIVANEILFREEMTLSTLGKLLDDVRTNLSSKNIDLPVATSDLGDDWSVGLANSSDYIMANIHPFFSGEEAKNAASWTYGFWERENGEMWKSEKSKNIISETGWPSSGGTSCGSAETCAVGSVAGIDEMNRFMGDWVCQALRNGTEYFWFEAFDEPWKIRFNEEGKRWEDKWGLMDVNRKLKDGVKIPDCGGMTVDNAQSSR